MVVESVVKSTLELQGFRVADVTGDASGLMVTIEPNLRFSPSCGQCRAVGTYRDTRPARRFRHVPLWGIAVELRYEPRRVSCPRRQGIHVVEERGHIWLDGATFKATFRSRYTYEEVEEVMEDGRLHGNVLIARTRIPAWRGPHGLGILQLMPTRGDHWLDGYAAWSDLDSQRVECSRNIWVRVGTPLEEGYAKLARELMAQEITIFKRRQKQRI